MSPLLDPALLLLASDPDAILSPTGTVISAASPVMSSASTRSTSTSPDEYLSLLEFVRGELNALPNATRESVLAAVASFRSLIVSRFGPSVTRLLTCLAVRRGASSTSTMSTTSSKGSSTACFDS